MTAFLVTVLAVFLGTLSGLVVAAFVVRRCIDERGERRDMHERLKAEAEARTDRILAAIRGEEP